MLFIFIMFKALEVEDKKEAKIINNSIKSAFVKITSTNVTAKANGTREAAKNNVQNVTSSSIRKTLDKKETPKYPLILNY